MAAGCDLNEGEYDSRTVTEDELWSAISCVFSNKSKNSSSYKYGFLKSILDNLYNTDDTLVLSFDLLFETFGEIYWNLILKYSLRQTPIVKDGRKTYLESILIETKEKYTIPDQLPFESLSDEIKSEVTIKIKNKCKRYVIGALFEDTNHLFYSFSKRNEYIKLNPFMYEFLCKHKEVIEKLNYYEWARFLEKVNSGSSVEHLLTKIDESSKRKDAECFPASTSDEAVSVSILDGITEEQLADPVKLIDAL